MGTSVVGKLDTQQTAALPNLRYAMAATGAQGSTTAFNFFAAFDGTNNDRNNLALSGDSYPTNIARLEDSAREAGATSKYYPGVGAQTVPAGTLDANSNPVLGGYPCP
jgi:hypothetical protein